MIKFLKFLTWSIFPSPNLRLFCYKVNLTKGRDIDALRPEWFALSDTERQFVLSRLDKFAAFLLPKFLDDSLDGGVKLSK
jgi:hypothetical protein